MNDFDLEKFERELCLGFTLQPNDFQRYKRVNPKLTREVYEHLRSNGSEWKILCGLSVSNHWGTEILKEVWYLIPNYKETDFYKFRFEPEKYLALNNW